MLAKDLMNPAVVTVGPDASVSDIAALLMEKRISAVPVIENDSKLCGIVSEGDLMRRISSEGDDKRSWWLKMTASNSEEARDFLKARGRTAKDIMTRNVTTVNEDTEVSEVAQLLESRHIKRVPVTDDGKVVGIISRSNLLQLVAGQKTEVKSQISLTDRELRRQIYDVLSNKNFASHGSLNVIVSDGEVELWGWVETEAERDALILAASEVPGVKTISDHFGKISPWVWGA